jgi:hypothetical protein
MDSSDRSSKSVTSPTSDEIPKDIAAEFQRMSDDADALLQSIRNDEVQAATPRRGKAGGAVADAGESSAAPAGQVARAGSFDEDDDMTDELHHLETVPDELQRLQRELDELDQEKLTELIHGNDDEEAFDQNQLRSTPLLSSASSSKQREVTARCSSSAAPHFALGNVSRNESPALYCQDVAGTSGSGITRQRKGAKSASKVKSPLSNATTTLTVAHQPPSTTAADPSSSASSGVMYPYDPAVAELRELMKAAIDDDGGEGNGRDENNKGNLVPHRGTGKHPPLHVPSHGRVLKAAPKSTLESINWVLVAAFVVVWVTVVVLMGRAHTDVLDEEGEIVHLPSILR